MSGIGLGFGFLLGPRIGGTPPPPLNPATTPADDRATPATGDEKHSDLTFRLLFRLLKTQFPTSPFIIAPPKNDFPTSKNRFQSAPNDFPTPENHFPAPDFISRCRKTVFRAPLFVFASPKTIFRRPQRFSDAQKSFSRRPISFSGVQKPFSERPFSFGAHRIAPKNPLSLKKTPFSTLLHRENGFSGANTSNTNINT